MFWRVLAAAGLLLALSVGLPAFVGGAWSPTPMRVVSAMLRAAVLKPGERLYDLGAGDGRIILEAAEKYGVIVAAVEIDPIKCVLMNWRIRSRGLQARAAVLRANFFSVDLSRADVVVLYLSQAAINRLAEKLAGELKDGARILSYRRDFPGWKPTYYDPEEDFYLYKMPVELQDPKT